MAANVPDQAIIAINDATQRQLANAKDVHLPEAVAIVNPSFSGALLKDYVHRSGRKVIGLFDLTDNELRQIPRPSTISEWAPGCDHIFQSKVAAEMIAYLDSLPYRVVAVIPGCEPAVPMADTLSEAMGLIGNPPSSSSKRRDKFAMREACVAAGLTTPDFRLCSTAEQAIEFSEQHSWPVVVKTLRGTGGADVTKCYSTGQVREAFETIVNGIDPFGQRCSQALIEEYLDGLQYWVDLLAVDGRLYTLGCGIWHFDKHEKPTHDEYITNVHHGKEYSAILDYAHKVAHATGLRWGPGFVELRDVPGKGPVLLEIASRLTGFGAPMVLRKISSIDPFQATLDTYLQGSTYVPPPVTYHKFNSTLYVKAKTAGIIIEYDGLKSLGNLPSYFSYSVKVPKGIKVNTMEFALLLHMAHESKVQLDEDILAAEQMVHIRVEEAGR